MAHDSDITRVNIERALITLIQTLIFLSSKVNTLGSLCARSHALGAFGKERYRSRDKPTRNFRNVRLNVSAIRNKIFVKQAVNEEKDTGKFRR